jgi:hypothetical protein
VGSLDKLGLQLAGQQALVDIVQDLVHQLGHDEALPGQWVGDAQLWYQEHSACRTSLNMTKVLRVSMQHLLSYPWHKLATRCCYVTTTSKDGELGKI